jgi:glycosyltransferase involved in cell wall biosynthesis
LLGTQVWALRVKHRIEAQGFRPILVHANDHLEGLLGLKLAAEVGVPKAIFLRSAGMKQDDFIKYQCMKFDLISVVGDGLLVRAKEWVPGAKLLLLHDGIEANELMEAKPKPRAFPKRILVIGSAFLEKGWIDLAEALYILQEQNKLPPITFDFTGEKPGSMTNDLNLSRFISGKFEFLGRVEKFRELVRGYDLVVNPSRIESFGMAAVEVIAAGVPLLSSRTGIIEQVQESKDLLFEPNNPSDLAKALHNLIVNWSSVDFCQELSQKNIRSKFMIDTTAKKLSDEYSKLV